MCSLIQSHTAKQDPGSAYMCCDSISMHTCAATQLSTRRCRLHACCYTLLSALTVHALHCCRWNAATGVVMSHEVARHVHYNTKLKALQRTPHHMIISRVRILLERLRDTPAAAPGSSKAAPGSGKPVDEQVTVICFAPAVGSCKNQVHSLSFA